MSTLLPLEEIPVLKGEFTPDEGLNEYRSRDGRRRLEIKLRPQGIRDLQAALLRMAQEVSKDRRLGKGIVAVWMPRATDDRIAREWRETLALFRPNVAERLSLLIVRRDRVLPLSEDRDLRRLGDALRNHLSRLEMPVKESHPALSRLFFEVFKVLLDPWLLGKGPLAIGELMRRTGASYPTVADALRRLEGARELARRSNRSVMLSRYPQRTWTEVLALSDTLRRTRYYADSSGRRADPMDLHRRLQATAVPHLALGGVQAARHWDPGFDLNGLPRLDVTLHRPRGIGDFGFLERLDPALKQVESGTAGIVLAVHPLFRADPRFERNPRGKIPWADPVETLLDLHELRLVDQAEAMVRRLTGVPGR